MQWGRGNSGWEGSEMGHANKASSGEEQTMNKIRPERRRHLLVQLQPSLQMAQAVGEGLSMAAPQIL